MIDRKREWSTQSRKADGNRWASYLRSKARKVVSTASLGKLVRGPSCGNDSPSSALLPASSSISIACVDSTGSSVFVHLWLPSIIPVP